MMSSVERHIPLESSLRARLVFRIMACLPAISRNISIATAVPHKDPTEGYPVVEDPTCLSLPTVIGHGSAYIVGLFRMKPGLFGRCTTSLSHFVFQGKREQRDVCTGFTDRAPVFDSWYTPLPAVSRSHACLFVRRRARLFPARQTAPGWER